MIAVSIVAVTAALSLVMAAAWAVQRRTRNCGWVDTIWTFGLGAAGIVYALLSLPNTRAVLVGAPVAMWSLRLGLHLAARTRHGPEDARYARFRRDWGDDFELSLFRFLQIQAAAAAVLAFTVLVAAGNPAPLGLGDAIGVAIFVIALAGEALADRQLQNFRRDKAHRNLICDRGLWRWSRHPNYFFEWLVWLAYPCVAINWHGGYVWGWLALSGPAFIYYLLVHVSGIPPLEQHMATTRGDVWRAYAARSRPFLPLP